ncbi:isochorismate synthase [Leptobacterium flavescens]|uniref:isochorismate synthase n=1 Tax=Leptobacterium flavescens TaxID=472055 RepID=A0A6P0UPY5_9FLAO|nr:chorismate-binding protein [Leptobacterium flavescens]NER13889.1 isochorismate synthase [Leptobacterium flavescens]
MSEKEVFYWKIRSHIGSGLPFVIYSEPEDEKIKGILQEDNEVISVKDFTESGFVFAPFNTREEEAILLRTDIQLLTKSERGKDNALEEFDSIYDSNIIRNHKKLVRQGIKAIKESELEKVVLSRVEPFPLEKNDPLEIFKFLHNTYPTAFVYFWHHPKIGTWLGATPETLLKVEEDSFSTMSLAGTLPYNEDEDVIMWGEKEKEEQQIVTDAIVSGLDKIPGLGNICVSEIETIQAGGILHLKSNISGSLEKASLKNILCSLHPTPAVCGYPREEARKFILENEKYHRSFYTGYLGELNMQNSEKSTNFTQLYVNLRCMQLKEQKAWIYVGGGITADSNPNLEWEETVNKSQTMKKVLLNII